VPRLCELHPGISFIPRGKSVKSSVRLVKIASLARFQSSTWRLYQGYQDNFSILNTLFRGIAPRDCYRRFWEKAKYGLVWRLKM
jgi:hypothetical protein